MLITMISREIMKVKIVALNLDLKQKGGEKVRKFLK